MVLAVGMVGDWGVPILAGAALLLLGALMWEGGGPPGPPAPG
jgi:hypothetical protein